MRKVFLFIIIFLMGCAQEVTQEPKETYEPETAEQKTDYQVPSDYAGIESNMDILLEMGGEIGPGHYEAFVVSIDNLEATGVDVSALREKLKTLPVALDSPQPKTPSKERLADIEKELDDIIANDDIIGYFDFNDLKEKVESINDDSLNAKFEIVKENHAIRDGDAGMADLSKLPFCTGDEKFTHSPVDTAIIVDISPLGSLNPPGHTYPTEHTYIHIGTPATEDIYPLYAVADMYITGFSEEDDSFEEGRKEYDIKFGLCKHFHGFHHHVKELRGKVKEAFDAADCTDWSVREGNFCWKEVFVEIKAGEEIGGVGHKQGNFDFGATDYRVWLDYVNPSNYGYSGGKYGSAGLHKVCPYDYYEEGPIKDKLFSLLDNIGEPKCWKVMQDVKGTLQGNWFGVEKAFSTPDAWDKQLAFVHDNSDPSIPVISIAGWFTDASKWHITPESSGLINREFAEVTADGNIYCYTGTNPFHGTLGGSLSTAQHTGKIIVQLVSDTQLKIEKQEGSCTGSEEFKEPFVYNR